MLSLACNKCKKPYGDTCCCDISDKILSIIQDGKDKGYEAETILQSIEAELTKRKYERQQRATVR